MTYGDQLDAAAAALARTQTTLRRPAPGQITDHEAAAIARTQIYKAIERQIAIIAGGLGTPFAKEIERATRHTARPLPPPPTPHHRIAVQLRSAADSIRTASDLLSAHFGPSDRPLTSDAMAVIAGVDRERSLAHLAQLARAANTIDRPLAVWLRQGYAAGSQQPVVRAATQDAERTASTPQPHTRRVAVTHTGKGWLRQLDTPPPTEAPADITTPATCITAIDTARAWLVRHRHNLTGTDLRLLTRTGLALCFETDYLIGATLTYTGTHCMINSLAAGWRDAATAANALQTLDQSSPGAGPAALAAAETWLRDHLRPDGHWRDPAQLRAAGDTVAWQATARELAARLPDIATLVHRGAASALERGELLAIAGWQQTTASVAIPRWSRADPETGAGMRLLDATTRLRERTVLLAEVAGVAPRPGLHEADLRYRRSRQDLQDELRRISQTKPIDPTRQRRASRIGTERAPAQRVEPIRGDAAQQHKGDQRGLDERRRLAEQRRAEEQQRRQPRRGPGL